ncbi:BMP family lipoprotein [Natronincola ferrireducens]|uniref:Basic membrane protein A n=1 Tax=Natronincola ferrireducens TaxID=393762 RepID=A0A1G9A6I9_9FIRM|nr:BMP family ABC transporter substrate-binding protein [Natronincola ferrireducens]SDK22992.1 basic membrane protein A [Natronincola ferrireducens]
MFNKKRVKFFVMLVVIGSLMFSLIGCGNQEQQPGQSSEESARVALVFTTAGRGDKNFNDMAYDGLAKAKEELGIEFHYGEPQSQGDYESQLSNFAESGEYDLIIALGFDQKDALEVVAQDFPEQNFLIIDTDMGDMPNVSAISTRWEEQTFLSGVIAGYLTQSDESLSTEENIVGVVLGVDAPFLRAGVAGFMAGAKYINPSVEILQGVVGAFNDPGTAQEIALSMYGRGADVIQHIAGASGLGVFEAASNENRYAIGVGANQNYINPDVVVATSIRNVHEIIYQEIESLINGDWTPGDKNWGIAENAVGYSVEQSNISLPQDFLEILEAIRTNIVSGELVLPNAIEDVEEWAQNNKYIQ